MGYLSFTHRQMDSNPTLRLQTFGLQIIRQFPKATRENPIRTLRGAQGRPCPFFPTIPAGLHMREKQSQQKGMLFRVIPHPKQGVQPPRSLESPPASRVGAAPVPRDRSGRLGVYQPGRDPRPHRNPRGAARRTERHRPSRRLLAIFPGPWVRIRHTEWIK